MPSSRSQVPPFEVMTVPNWTLLFTLLLTAMVCVLMGCGIPTTANYIIMVAVAAPVLGMMGVEPLVAHFFVIYYGVLADVTPPVALACFAAAPIAKESGLKISFEAVKVAAAGFVVPFMAVYTPALMLQDGGPLALCQFSHFYFVLNT